MNMGVGVMRTEDQSSSVTYYLCNWGKFLKLSKLQDLVCNRDSKKPCQGLHEDERRVPRKTCNAVPGTW